VTGKTHLTGGIAAAAALHAARLLPELAPHIPTGMITMHGVVLPVLLPGMAVAVVASLLPDIDEPQSLISNSPNAIRAQLGTGRRGADRAARRGAGVILQVGNILTRTLAQLVRLLAGGHRAATHVLPIAAALTVGMYYLGASLGFPSLWIWFAAGYLSHLLLDMMTPAGLALFWPLSKRDWHILPSFLRMQTGGGGDVFMRTFLLLLAVGLVVVG
jgi:membrane-bound metal-dependent hydrolase YbcI (DUF457 family)